MPWLPGRRGWAIHDSSDQHCSGYSSIVPLQYNGSMFTDTGLQSITHVMNVPGAVLRGPTWAEFSEHTTPLLAACGSLTPRISSALQ